MKNLEAFKLGLYTPTSKKDAGTKEACSRGLQSSQFDAKGWRRLGKCIRASRLRCTEEEDENKAKRLKPYLGYEVFEFSWVPHSVTSFDDVCVEVTVLHETRGRLPKFMGKACVPGCSFAKRGEEGLTFYSLERKGISSQIKGTIALKVYYHDEDVPTNA